MAKITIITKGECSVSFRELEAEWVHVNTDKNDRKYGEVSYREVNKCRDSTLKIRLDLSGEIFCNEHKIFEW